MRCKCLFIVDSSCEQNSHEECTGLTSEQSAQVAQPESPKAKQADTAAETNVNSMAVVDKPNDLSEASGQVPQVVPPSHPSMDISKASSPPNPQLLTVPCLDVNGKSESKSSESEEPRATAFPRSKSPSREMDSESSYESFRSSEFETHDSSTDENRIIIPHSRDICQET